MATSPNHRKPLRPVVRCLHRPCVPLEYIAETCKQLKPWNKDDSFAKFPSETASDFDERAVFEWIDYTNPDTDYNITYTRDKIGKPIQMNFEKAIKLLMNEEID